MATRTLKEMRVEIDHLKQSNRNLNINLNVTQEIVKKLRDKNTRLLQGKAALRDKVKKAYSKTLPRRFGNAKALARTRSILGAILT